jgi:hypothetical protein
MLGATETMHHLTEVPEGVFVGSGAQARSIAAKATAEVIRQGGLDSNGLPWFALKHTRLLYLHGTFYVHIPDSIKFLESAE